LALSQPIGSIRESGAYSADLVEIQRDWENQMATLKQIEAAARLRERLIATEQSGAVCGKFYPDDLRIVLDAFDALRTDLVK
jgi:hypothetical protein